MEFTQNYFELFGLPTTVAVDLDLLSHRYRELQKTLHPDRFAGRAERDQLLAVQYAARLNDAYTTLKSPIKRVRYLLQLAGCCIAGDSTTTLDAQFLMQQMAWRESLEEVGHAADPDAQLERLAREVAKEAGKLLEGFQVTYQHLGALGSGAERDAVLARAVEQVKKLQFMDKMRLEIEALEDELADI